MKNTKVLCVTDDFETYHLLDCIIKQSSLELAVASSIDEARQKISRMYFDICLIDFCGNGMDALAVCAQLRPQFTNPILVFEYDGREPRALQAYRAGVDEYIAKPIGLQLVMAKVMVWLRRSQWISANSQNRFKVGELKLNPDNQQLVNSNGTSIKLTELEFRLLSLLVSNQGQVLDKNYILRRVWKHNVDGDANLVKNVIYRLRRKIEPEPKRPRYIQTMAGRGYLFQNS